MAIIGNSSWCVCTVYIHSYTHTCSFSECHGLFLYIIGRSVSNVWYRRSCSVVCTVAYLRLLRNMLGNSTTPRLTTNVCMAAPYIPLSYLFTPRSFPVFVVPTCTVPSTCLPHREVLVVPHCSLIVTIRWIIHT